MAEVASLKKKIEELQKQIADCSISQMNSSGTVTLDVSSITALENSSSNKPPIFKGTNFKDWDKKLTYYLNNLDEYKYLSIEVPTENELVKSKKIAQKIISLIAYDMQDAFFDESMTACSLYKNLKSTFGSADNRLRSTVYSLFNMKAADYPAKELFIKDFRLLVARFKTLKVDFSDDILKEFLIQCLGDSYKQLRPFYDSLKYSELIAKLESLINSNQSNLSNKHQVDYTIFSSEQKKRFTNYHKRRSPPSNRYYNKNRQTKNNHQKQTKTNNQQQSSKTTGEDDASSSNNHTTDNQQQKRTAKQQINLLSVSYSLSSTSNFNSSPNVWIIEGASTNSICIHRHLFTDLNTNDCIGDTVVSGKQIKLIIVSAKKSKNKLGIVMKSTLILGLNR